MGVLDPSSFLSLLLLSLFLFPELRVLLLSLFLFPELRVREKGAALGTETPRKGIFAEASGPTNRSLVTFGLFFFIFLVAGEPSKNNDFLASHQNVENRRISRTWDANVAILDRKT